MTPEKRAHQAIAAFMVRPYEWGPYEKARDAIASAIKAAETDAREKALEEAASLQFLMRIPEPETGPFTIGKMAVEDYAAAIRSLKSGEGRDE